MKPFKRASVDQRLYDAAADLVHATASDDIDEATAEELIESLAAELQRAYEAWSE